MSLVPPPGLTTVAASAPPLVSRELAVLLASRIVLVALLLMMHDGAAPVGGAAVADAEGAACDADRVGRLEGDAHAGVEGAHAAAPGHLLGRGVGQVEQGVVDGRAAQHDAVGRRRRGAGSGRAGLFSMPFLPVD